MNKFDDILYKLKKFKYPSIYILFFIVFGMILNNVLLLITVCVLFTIFLLFLNKDNILTIIAIGNYNSGKSSEALVMFKKLIDNNTKNATSYAYYGNTLLLEEKPNEAIPYLEKGLTLKCDSIIHKNLVLTLSSCYWVLGDIKKAISLLEELKAKYSYLNHSVLATLGYLYILENDLDKALENTNLALLDNENSSTALDNMGQIELKKNNIESAKEYFEKALLIKEDLVDSIYYLGVIALMENDKNSKIEAKKYFEKALTCNISVMNTVTKEEILEKLEEVKNSSIE